MLAILDRLKSYYFTILPFQANTSIRDFGYNSKWNLKSFEYKKFSTYFFQYILRHKFREFNSY